MSDDITTWNTRIPSVVKEYLQNKKGLSGGQCLINYYKILKREEPLQLQQEKEKLLKRVAQIDTIVAHHRAQCGTNWQKCDTIFDKLSKQTELFSLKPPNDWTQKQIKYWLEKNDIYDITVNQFIQHYQKNGEESK